MKILILGGYGTFGGRLAQLLSGESRFTLYITGRSKSKAESFCKTLPSAAMLIPLSLDRHDNLEGQLKELRPDVVVDASGPFQVYDGDPYHVVKTCIALGIHYMDFADGSAFVKGIHQFDAEARASGVFVLCGVSSFPVLTAAVVKKLTQGLKTVSNITGGIAPSPYAGVGLNVIRAVMSYAGKPIELTRGGKKTVAHGLTESVRYTIAPPGYLPLNNLRFSLVDVPDLQLVPESYPELDSIWIGVALVPESLHRMLNGFAWLVKKSIIPTLLPYAAFMHNVINVVCWGEDRGGMFVSVTGTNDEGKMIERSWHMLAEGKDGLMIPSMAIEAIVRRMLNDKIPAFGARPALEELELEDYETLFQKRSIYAGFRGMLPMPSRTLLYQEMLDEAWNKLPEPIRAMHDFTSSKTVSGMATVERGTNFLPRLAGAIMGFPKAGSQVPVTVNFQLRYNKEIWTRTFAGKSFSSVQFKGKGRFDKLLCERFGPFNFGLALLLKNDELHLVVRRWSFLGIPMPAFLAPGGYSYEHVKDGKFHFHVEITLPLIGLIVRYQGWLTHA